MNRLLTALFSICAVAASAAPRLAVHPFVQAELDKYPPLRLGGHRIVMIGGDRAAVIGIGRAKLVEGFSRAAAAAELDADAQIATALNAVAAECETRRNTDETTASDGSVRMVKTTYRLVALSIAARTPFVCSGGMWQRGDALYCARILWCGESDTTPGDGEKWSDLPESLPYLGSGGTVALRRGGALHLVTVVRVPEKLPPPQDLQAARMQAYRNLLYFVSGGRLKSRIATLSETISTPDEFHRRRRKRKKLENAISGHCRFLEPLAKWRIVDTGCDFYLFVVNVDAAVAARD